MNSIGQTSLFLQQVNSKKKIEGRGNYSLKRDETFQSNTKCELRMEAD